MLVRLQCPACAKALMLECNAATQVLLCRACGAQFNPPEDCLLPAEPSGTTAVAVAPTRVGRRRHPHLMQAVIAIAAVLAMIGGLTLALMLRGRPRPSTIQASGVPASVPSTQPVTVPASPSRGWTDQVLALKTEADVLALSGNFSGAAEKYKQLRKLLEGQEASDPLAKALAEQVVEGQRNLEAIMSIRAHAVAAPASSPLNGPPSDSRSDFGPAAAVAGVPSSPAEVADFDPPASAAPSTSSTPSDFGSGLPANADHANRLIPAAALEQMRGMSDAEIGRAIERGTTFLLSQFKDGEISPDTVLSDSQRQALDALCVYALAQSGLSINDSRLGSHGKVLSEMLDKLRSYDLSSDGQTTNRPITYGRSLRSAALATYNRAEDNETLKQDVAWLIANQIGGAYTYDDLYVQMMKQGMKPADDGAPASVPAPRPEPPTSQQDRDSDFGGSSVPPPVTPGEAPHVRDNVPVPNYPPVFRYVPPPFTRAFMGDKAPHPTAPKPNGGVLIPGGGGTYFPPSLNDGKEAVLPAQTFIYPWDNSNSQYGLLGVWAGAETGMEVPDQYWRDVEHHWIKCQLGSGQWAYHAHDPMGYYAMTVGGAASLLVTHDYLDIPLLKGAVGREPYSNNLQAALNWLDQGNNSVSIPSANTHYVGYDLFGIERVGLASGYKYFGSHDWYRELAGKVVPLQFTNGAWGHEDHGNDAVVDTAYTLLFLARGRHPVMMTKLQFPGSWDNRPRDIANLARFAGGELERPINWQVVGIDHDWQDYFDSPVLYIASHQAPQFQEADYMKLRSFVLAGGLIFTQADGASESFNNWVPELAKRIAPTLRLEPLPENNPIYNIQYKVTSHPRLLGVFNGSRLLLIHSPGDLSLAWQSRSVKTKRYAFELGVNIFVYASGKPDLRNRLDSPYVPPAPQSGGRTLALAELKYEGNWNPEPAAWFRMSRYLQWEGDPTLNIRPVGIEQLAPGSAPLATLTGTDPHTFSSAEAAALRAYVQAGGTLLIDSVGGENAFTRSVREKLLPAAFGDAVEEPMGPDHPLFKDLKAGLANASPVRLRSYAIDRLGQVAPAIRLLKVGTGHVIFSALDLTSGLLGTNTWGIVGYESVSAEKFARNVVEWVETRH